MRLRRIPSPHGPARHVVPEQLLQAVLLLLGWSLLLCSVLGCGQDARPGSDPASTNPAAPAGTDPQPSSVGTPNALDLSAVIRRVHFAFRAEGDAWTGGHSTYGVRVSEDELRVSPYQPVSGPPTPGGAPPEGISGAPFIAKTERIDRGGASILGASGGISLAEDSSLRIDRGGVIERLENTEDGVEQSFVFSDRPAGQGDVTVRLSVSGQAYTGATEHGLHFVDPQTGLGVRYGTATWIDAAQHATRLAVAYEAGAIVLTVPAHIVEESAYPAVLDPTVGPEIGTDNPVYAAAIGDQFQTAMAYGNGNYLVVWQDNRFATTDLFGTRVTPAGTVLDTSGIPVAVAKGNQISPKVAFDGTNWMVVWSDTRNTSGDIYAARVSGTGTVLDPNGVVVAAGGSRTRPAIAWDGTNYFVTYIVSSNVQGNFVSPAGTVNPMGISIFTVTSLYYQNVAFNGTNYLVAFDYFQSSFYRVGAKRVTPGGSVLDATEIQVGSTSGGYLPIGIDSDGVNWLVSWVPASTNYVYGGRVSAAGTALDGSGFQIALTSTLQANGLSVAFAGNGYGVFWDAASEIYGARVSSGGAVFVPATALVNEAGSSTYPSAAHDGTNFFVAFRDTRLTASNNPADVFGLRISNALAKVDMTSILLSQAANSQFRPAVAYNGTNYLVVWDDFRPGTTSDIYGARISAAGTVLDPAGLTLSQAANSQMSPAVASNGTDWLVTWRDARGADLDIYGTRVQANGTVLEPMGLLIAGGATTQDSPAVASDGSAYLVTWAVSGGDIYGARVSAAGSVLDPNGFAISTGGGSFPALAYSGTNYLVAWTKPTNSNDIFAARVTSAGTVLDAGALAIPVAASVGVAETNAGVSSNGTTWLVVWNDASDVRGARINASGTLLDPIGIVISAATNVQSYPKTSWDGSQYWIVWQDSRASAADTDVYAARMSSAAMVTDPMGIAVATDVLQSEQRPVIAAGKPKENLVAYYRFDPEQPFGATRIRSRIVADPTPGANGTPCTMAGECTSGFCTDGVCCDLACSGVCQACTAAKKGAGSDGTCGSIKVDTDPDNECTDQGAPSCGTTGDCSGAGSCKLYPSGTDCGTVCAGNSVQNKACDGVGACANSGMPIDCTPYACSGGACNMSCMTASDCAAGYSCNGGVCGVQSPNGSACSSAGQCQSGFCTDGVCCDASCTGLCQACTFAKKGNGNDGVCGPITAGSDPDNECTMQVPSSCGQTGQCSGAGACQLYAQGTSCGVSICQGNVVTGQICNGSGMCVTDPVGQDCTPYICSGGACTNPCTTSNECVAGYICSGGACIPVGTIGTPCTNGLECLSGFCVEGVCCDSACTGTCVACATAKKGQGTDGVCEPIKSNTDPDSECAAQAPSTCGQNGLCNGMGACGIYPAGTICSPPSCSGTTQTNASQCDGMGMCTPGSMTSCVLGYVCVGDTCATDCTDNSSCAPGYMCDTMFGYCTLGDPPDGGTTTGTAAGGTGGMAAGAGGSGTASNGSGGNAAGGNGGSATGGGSGTPSGAGGMSSGTGGSSSTSGSSPTDEGGCGCRTTGGSPSPAGIGAMMALALAAHLRRRRRAG